MAGRGWCAGLFRFCIVGASGVLVNLAVFLAAVRLGASLLPASVLAFAVAASTNFFLNRAWTFNGVPAGSGRAVQWAKFIGGSVAGLGANLVVLWALTDLPGKGYILAQLAGVGAGTLLNFQLSRSFVFAGPKPAAGLS